jgi:Prolyl oligopeptidase family
MILSRRFTRCLGFTMGFLALGLSGPARSQDAPPLPDLLRPLFSPAPLVEESSTYPSPLRRDNGELVTRAADWPARRAEILEFWHGAMGAWPEIISQPKVEILETTERENFTQHKIEFLWTPTELTEGYLLVPEGPTVPRPAVVTVYYEPETLIGEGSENRDFALALARRGFVTLAIGTREASAAKTYSIYWPSLENAKVQPLSMLAYAAANAWQVLAARPEVDAKRIGIVGHSFGGKWAMFASCLYDQFACAAWSDPGIVFDDRDSVNYWEPWYLGYHAPPWRARGMPTVVNPIHGLYPELRASGHDLTELHALMAPRPFLVSGGSEDPPSRWAPLRHSIAVNTLLGYENRVAMHNRPEHAPNPQSNEVIYQFFEHFLGPVRR